VSWYDSNWALRLPVSLNNLSGASTIDGTIQIGADVPLFWDSVRGDGFDVRFTGADGNSALAYNRAAWNYSAKTAQFDIDAISAGNADATCVIWMYFGNASTTDGSTSPSIASAKTGSLELSANSTPVVILAPFRPGETICQQRVTKAVAEEIDVWIDCRRALQARSTASQGSLRYEEIGYVQVAVESGGTDDAGRYDEALTTVSDPGWVKVRVKGGASGSDYTLVVTIGTSQTRVLEARAIVDVQDIDES
jgi:hypothetical protein